MKKNIKKWLAGILAAVCLAGTLAGCGGQGTGAVSSETDASASVVSASDSTSAEAGKYSFTFKDSLGTEFTLEQPLEKNRCAEPSDRRSSEDFGGGG